jgi:hypothetical protein
MTTIDHLTQSDAASARPHDLRIRVVGAGLFVVMRGSRELLRGTFEQCYDYVNAALQGPREGLTC